MPSIPAMTVLNRSSTSGMDRVTSLTIPFFPRTLTESTQTEAIIRSQTLRRFHATGVFGLVSPTLAEFYEGQLLVSGDNCIGAYTE